MIITERGRPVARIVPLNRDEAAKLEDQARLGLVRLGSTSLPRGFWRLPRPAPTHGAGVRALVEEQTADR